MNRLNPLHKQILNSLADDVKNNRIAFTKKQLRQILIHYSWNKSDAKRAIESGQCDYWFLPDDEY